MYNICLFIYAWKLAFLQSDYTIRYRMSQFIILCISWWHNSLRLLDSQKRVTK